MVSQMGEVLTSASTPEGPGSVSGAPNLPAGFTDTFTSRYVDTGELRLHVLGALRQTSAGSALVHSLTAAPDLDGRSSQPRSAATW